MNDLVATAALNNARHCETVLAAQGATGQIEDYFWVNFHALDLPYAHDSTLGGPACLCEQMSAIERLLKSRPVDCRTVVADSWSNLDLEPLGFRVLFADSWFVRQPENTDTASSPGRLRIVQVTSPKLLAEFEAADVKSFQGNQVDIPDVPGWHYAPDLLDDSRMVFLAGLVGDQLVAGAIAFNDGQSVGLYTLITLPEARRNGYGEAMIRETISASPELPIVTNPSAMSQGLFEQAGFCSAGKRTIWVHEPGATFSQVS